MGTRYQSILETIGNTPTVKINKLGPDHVNLFVKIEAFNPMGSVKDRLALGVIEDAEKRGELKPGQTVVEATSGNTGIGLAMVCAQKGYPLVVVMAENFSVERRRLMRFLGARVVLTPASEMGSGMVAKAAELAAAHGWWQSRQFENPANADIHARTTAEEIIADFADIGLDYWVTGFGTGGTLNGVSRVLKAKSPSTRIMLCEPDNSQLLGSGIAQPRNDDGGHQTHPGFRPHLMQGWSPNFIPGLVEPVTAANNIDGFLAINGNFAMQCAMDLAQKEGIFVGTSSGATFAGALQVAEQAPAGSNILCMLPDTGERYLSTPLFDSISEDMNAAEMEISCSTPGYRFDIGEPQSEATDDAGESTPVTDTSLDPSAQAEVDETLAENRGKVVMFSLEWCEFCWSVRKMMDSCGIPYVTVDLDSVAYQENDRGGKILEVLMARNDWPTIPQIFVGDEFVGGATDLFDVARASELEGKLDAQKIPYNENIKRDPYSYLPTWLHPR
ncbi:MAG: pyridoxal-phosphate dependent enzyme [Gammaproteobacteria bacterium]|nr:pyridoxal-phosphate dependent enzyme [Gammaproteobacteria bacterium]